jgi:hypothetical protein
MTTQEAIIERIRRYPAKTNSEIASCMRSFKLCAADVEKVRATMTKPGQPGQPAAIAHHQIGKSVSVLFDQFDELAKVRSVMKTLPRSNYLDDDEMRTVANVPMRAWNSVKAHASLAQFRFKLPNQRYVWAHPTAQQELQDAINLSQS